MNYFLLLIISFMFGIGYAGLDGREILLRRELGGGKLNHNSRTIIRCVVFSLLSLLTFGFTWTAVLGFFLSGSAFYLVFDIFINTKLEQAPFKPGTTSKVDKWFYKRFAWRAGFVMFGIELGLFIIFNLTYLL